MLRITGQIGAEWEAWHADCSAWNLSINFLPSTQPHASPGHSPSVPLTTLSPALWSPLPCHWDSQSFSSASISSTH